MIGDMKIGGKTVQYVQFDKYNIDEIKRLTERIALSYSILQDVQVDESKFHMWEKKGIIPICYETAVVRVLDSTNDIYIPQYSYLVKWGEEHFDVFKCTEFERLFGHIL